MDFSKIQKNPKESKSIQKSKRIQKNPKKSKESKEFQMIPERESLKSKMLKS